MLASEGADVVGVFEEPLSTSILGKMLLVSPYKMSSISCER